MGIREDAVTVLVTLATYGKRPDDPERGKYQFNATEAVELTGLTPSRLNDALDYLASRAMAKTLKAQGTHIIIGLSAEGRLEAEKFSGTPQAHETDQLLTLYNRGKFEADLPRILAQHAEGRFPVALCMLDIDHFKSFNDNHGHQSGDKVLQNTAVVLRDVVGNKGNCYRYGGEELSVILPNYTRAEVDPLAERIRAGIESSPVGALPRVTVSIGVALTETTGYAAQALVKSADDALYAAKGAGRNRVVIAAAR
jgi:diguanylate cyclase (GGDEF)-like protein